jgi:hypothetical protein
MKSEQAAVEETVPEIVLRIPGPWRHPEELAGALPTGFQLSPGRLALPGGGEVEFHPRPADTDFPIVFELASGHRLARRQRRSIERYAMIACLLGSGGSTTAARRMQEAGAALLCGGGLGVFVDNGLRAHLADDWLELTESDEPGALVAAFVTIRDRVTEIQSLGMNVMGRPDAMISRSGETAEDMAVLISFLDYLCEEETRTADGDFFVQGPRTYRIVTDRAPPLRNSGPLHNPYGMWRLEDHGNGGT